MRRASGSPIIAEDTDGTGFECHKYYQIYLGANGMRSRSTAMPTSCSTAACTSAMLGCSSCAIKLNGKKRVPRQSVKAADASRCMAVVLPLVKVSGRWVPDRTKVPPLLVPLLSLGRQAEATEGVGGRAGTFAMGLAVAPAGGPELQALSLSSDLFEAAAMRAVEKDLMAMKVAELKEELEARGEGKTGNKAWLRRRLHAAILHNYLEAADEGT